MCSSMCRDIAAVVCTGFVVEDDSVDVEVAGMEAQHDGAGGRNAVAVVFGGKWLDEYCVAGMVVGNHYVLVAALGLDGEAPGVVGVEAMKQKLAKVQLRRWQLLGTGGLKVVRACLGVGGCMERTCCRVWNWWPLMMASAQG